MFRTTSILLAGLLLAVFVAVPASAQQGVAPQQQPQQVPDVDVDQDELATIAEAYVDVQSLTQEFNEVVQQAGDAQEAQELQAEYAERANELVRNHGLTVERYDLVVRAATMDEELRERLLTEINRIIDENG